VYEGEVEKGEKRRQELHIGGGDDVRDGEDER
jgi:hypothetical protein